MKQITRKETAHNNWYLDRRAPMYSCPSLRTINPRLLFTRMPLLQPAFTHDVNANQKQVM